MAETSGCAKVAAWFCAIVGVLVVLGYCSAQQDNDERRRAESVRRSALTAEEQEAEDRAKADRNELLAAVEACRQALKQSLHDPDSVQWDESPGWYRERKPEGHILVQPRARAKNAFGAYRHGVWECTVLPVGGNVQVTGLEQIQQ